MSDRLQAFITKYKLKWDQHFQTQAPDDPRLVPESSCSFRDQSTAKDTTMGAVAEEGNTLKRLTELKAILHHTNDPARLSGGELKKAGTA